MEYAGEGVYVDDHVSPSSVHCWYSQNHVPTIRLVASVTDMLLPEPLPLLSSSLEHELIKTTVRSVANVRNNYFIVLKVFIGY